MQTIHSSKVSKFGKIAAGLTACAAATVAAYAAVVLDLSNGAGFVGKGDVQTAFGWNNKQLQDAVNSGDISFSYVVAGSYSVTCGWTTGPADKPHSQTKTTSADATAVATYSNKNSSSGKNGDFTGFNLLFSNYAVVGDPEFGNLPSVGDPCPGYQGNGKAVTQVESTGMTGGLYVNFRGTSVLLPSTL